MGVFESVMDTLCDSHIFNLDFIGFKLHWQIYREFLPVEFYCFYYAISVLFCAAQRSQDLREALYNFLPFQTSTNKRKHGSR